MKIKLLNMMNFVKRNNAYFYIFLFILFSRLFTYFLYLILASRYNFNFSLSSFINRMNIWDSGWYFKIITKGYGYVSSTGGGNVGFFPLFPIIIRTIHLIIPIDILLIGSIFSTICLYFVCLFSYKYILLTRNKNNKSQALFIVAVLCFGPFSWYCSILYTESLFMLLSILFYFFLKKEKYISMGVVGMLLSATRNTGIFYLFVPIIYNIYLYFKTEDKKSIKSFILFFAKKYRLIFGVCLVPIGLFSYMFFLYFKFGDALAFSHIQYAWGHSMNINIFKSYIMLAKSDFIKFLIVNFSILISIYLIIEKRFEEAFYPIVVLLICAVGTNLFGSVQRYLFSTLTLLFGLSDAIYKIKSKIKIYIVSSAIIIVLSGIEFLYVVCWLLNITNITLIY